MRFSTAVIIAASFASAVTAIDTIKIKDRHFYNERTGEPFFIKGIDYQPGGSAAVERGSDPLSDPDQCARDIFLFQQLGVNTIRIYSVDPYLNHDECMTMLAAAGIYLVLDVNSPLQDQHLHNLEPWTTYTPMYLKHIFEVIEVFSGYDNTLAFLAGNEVVHKEGSEDTVPPYLKAVVRDMKAYISNHVSRMIPVGYSNADNIEFRVSLAEYLSCGLVGYVDFWAINSYQWCGRNTFEGSGFNTLVETFQNYSLPIFFSEYGCNEVRPRPFQEVQAIYSDQMTGVFSGGLVYEFTQEPADYGVVTVDKSGNVELGEEFAILAKAHADSGPGSIPDNVEINKRPLRCRAADTYPNINANPEIPAQLVQITGYIEDGVPKGKWARGKFVDQKSLTLTTTHKITDHEGKEIKDKTVKLVEKTEQKTQKEGGHGFDNGGGIGKQLPENVVGPEDEVAGEDKPDAASSVSAFTFGTACVAAIAVIFSAL